MTEVMPSNDALKNFDLMQTWWTAYRKIIDQALARMLIPYPCWFN